MSVIPHLTGLSEVSDQYDFFLLDIFGLLHNGVRLNPGTLDCLSQLRANGKKTCLVSNTPKCADSCIEDLTRHGIERDMYDHIFTAGDSARIELSEKYRNKRVMFLGNEFFAGPMEGLNILQVADLDQAEFILNSIPGSMSVDGVKVITLLHEARNKNLKMVCANPDLVVHIGEVLHTCAGTYAAFYEGIGGEVSYHGKPYAGIYDLALAALGNPDKARVCALGDALRTDVAGAADYGISSIWALSGIHWEELRYEEKPDHPDMERVAKVLAENPNKPTATMTDFRW